MMILSVDNLAHRYGQLPSEVLERASTFDLYVLDVSSRYVKYQQDKANGKTKPVNELSKEQMLDMIKKTKERKKK